MSCSHFRKILALLVDASFQCSLLITTMYDSNDIYVRHPHIRTIETTNNNVEARSTTKAELSTGVSDDVIG